MSWQYITAILDTECTLEKTLNKVAPCSEDHYDESETYPCRNAQHVRCSTDVCKVADDTCYNENENTATNASFPTLLRTDTWEEFVLAEERTAEISTCIICPRKMKILNGRRKSKVTCPISPCWKANTLIIEKGNAIYICPNIVYAQLLIGFSFFRYSSETNR